jgi:hypothetical protein
MRFKATSSPPVSPAPLPEKLQEVEFALVLSNIIQSLKSDPAQLRSTVYELARLKLQDQLDNLDGADAERLTQSLEIAIRGVEDFSIRRDNPNTLRPISSAVRSGALLPSPGSGNTTDEVTLAISAERKHNGHAPTIAGGPPSSEQTRRPVGVPSPAAPIRTRRVTYTLRFVLAATIVIAVAVTAYQQAIIKPQPRFTTTEVKDPRVDDALVSQSSPAPPSPAVSPLAASQPTGPASPLPTTFGVYAVSANKIFELEALPIRAPDRRIAMSAVINTPSRITLPDGRIKFIVFRRDSSINAIERPEIRVVAKVARAVTFEDGKANVSDKDDSWIIRNISRELKAAPIKDNPEMYEILDNVGEAPLSSGRYVLVLRGQAYDFTIEGTVTDLNQCLERTTAANGSFFSECRKR